MNRGDIYNVDLGPIPNDRKEQAGVRPAIAVSLGSLDKNNPLVSVIPLTTNLSSKDKPFTLLISPSQYNNLKQPSLALVSHVGPLDKRQILNFIGHLERPYMEKINQLLKDLFRLQ